MVRWLVTLKGTRQDVERILAGSPAGPSACSEDRELILVEVLDSEHDLATDESRQAGRTLIDAAVRHLNGFGRLQWGRAFDGLQIQRVQCIDSDGHSEVVVFTNPAYEHMEPEDFAVLLERLGRPRPELPVGLDDVRALDLATVVSLADNDPEVARVLRLVEIMLEGDEDIDWAAGYAALEVIDQYTRRHGASGQALGWWTRKEYDRFTQMANSVEAVGIRSRHQGRKYAPPKKALSRTDATWFVRRVTARWVTWLADKDSATVEDGGTA